MSPVGTSRHFVALRNLVAIGWRVRCGKSTIGLECLVDVLDLACGSREHSGPNQAFGDEVSGSASFGNLGDFSSSSIRISRILQRTSDPGCSEWQYKTDGSERA